jgi:hypothetical protein
MAAAKNVGNNTIGGYEYVQANHSKICSKSSIGNEKKIKRGKYYCSLRVNTPSKDPREWHAIRWKQREGELRTTGESEEILLDRRH